MYKLAPEKGALSDANKYHLTNKVEGIENGLQYDMQGCDFMHYV